MKWFLSAATIFSLTLSAAHKDDSLKCFRPQGSEDKGCQPDLFKMYDQIYAGNVEFLYWGLVAGGLDYAIRMTQSAWGTTPSYAQGNFQTAKYDLDPGLRVCLTYFRAPHYWDMRWQYTRMTNRGSDQQNKPDPSQNFLTGTWPQVSSLALASAMSQIHFNYNVFDWIASRVFFPNPHLRLRVMAGTTFTWMNQDWKIKYTDVQAQSTTIRNKWYFMGGGLKNGVMVDWYITKDFYMTGLGSFGLLMGGYSNQAKQTANFQPSATDNPLIPLRNGKYADVRPAFTTQMSFGPSYQKNLASNRIELFAGFEMNAWFNLQEVYRSTSGSASAEKQTWINSSAVAFYGLTTRLTVDF